MNAVELFHADGKGAGVFYCAECRHVHREKLLADECCAARKCDCGEPCDRHYTRCPKCVRDERRRQEMDRFEKAEKVTEWDGPVQCDGIGYNDGYFANLSELLDFLHTDSECAEWPEYVWTCFVKPICQLDLYRILENATEPNAPEDWDISRLSGRKEMEAAIEVFNKANEAEVYWTPNTRRALLMPKREEAAE